MLKLKIPPPLVGLTLGVLVWVVNYQLPMLGVDLLGLKLLACLLVLTGLLIELWSVGLFIKARTTVNPLKPGNSNHLVTSGLYRFSRNPMYLGMSLLLVGFVFWIGNPVGLVMPALFVWYITRFQIKPEEQALTKLFGDQFVNYQSRVRRWV